MRIHPVRSWVSVLVWACAWVPAFEARAFSIDDHEALTRHAIAEFNRCFPSKAVFPSEEAAIVNANESEDLNVFRKWASYSHYLHPHKAVSMRRSDSSERIVDLLQDFDRHGRSREPHKQLKDIGHMIHHVQDMASPPHVVPVKHWLTDGFEKYELPIGTAATPCSRTVAAAFSDFQVLLYTTAETTLNTVRNGKIPAMVGGISVELPLAGFWLESPANEFGGYGIFGNSFGETKFESGSREYFVKAADYSRFKQKQLRLAIEATKAALLIWKSN